MTGTQIKIFLGFKDLGQSQSFSSDTSSTHSLIFLVGSGLFHSMLAAIPRDGHPMILQPLPSLVSRGLWHFPWCQAPASLHDAPPLSPRVSSQLRMYLYQQHLLASCWDFWPCHTVPSLSSCPLPLQTFKASTVWEALTHCLPSSTASLICSLAPWLDLSFCVTLRNHFLEDFTSVMFVSC